jgi:hypothetical protein
MTAPVWSPGGRPWPERHAPEFSRSLGPSGMESRENGTETNDKRATEHFCLPAEAMLAPPGTGQGCDHRL